MKLYGRTVVITDNNVEKALRKFKKKINETGLLQELRDRQCYVKPTTEKKIKKSRRQKDFAN